MHKNGLTIWLQITNLNTTQTEKAKERIFTGVLETVKILVNVQLHTAFYNEVKDYDYDNPGFSLKTGHFTQVHTFSNFSNLITFLVYQSRVENRSIYFFLSNFSCFALVPFKPALVSVLSLNQIFESILFI